MIHIRKGKEPREFQEFRNQADSEYGNMPGKVKKILLAALCAEQHGLCAYCTCRIPEKAAEKRLQEPMTIEHFYPQHPDNGKRQAAMDLKYKNMHAVCSGNRGCGKETALTCDARKKDKVIQLNPCNEAIISQLYYQSDGTIRARDPELDGELKFALNLNCPERSLPQNRKAVLTEIQRRLPQDSDFRSECSKCLDSLLKKPTPFCGMAVEWLKKKAGK